MSILIAYGTIEGQTGKIAKFIDAALQAQGHQTVLLDTSDTSRDVDWTTIEKAVLAGSVHERRHPKAFEVFVYAHRAELNAMPTLVASVSLNAAFPEGEAEALEYVQEMKSRCGLDGGRDLLVAGALRSARYDYYATQVLQHVILRGKPYNPHETEHEFTDWESVKAVVTEFAEQPVVQSV